MFDATLDQRFSPYRVILNSNLKSDKNWSLKVLFQLTGGERSREKFEFCRFGCDRVTWLNNSLCSRLSSLIYCTAWQFYETSSTPKQSLKINGFKRLMQISLEPWSFEWGTCGIRVFSWLVSSSCSSLRFYRNIPEHSKMAFWALKSAFCLWYLNKCGKMFTSGFGSDVRRAPSFL